MIATMLERRLIDCLCNARGDAEFFRDLSTTATADFASHATLTTFARGAILYREEQPASFVHLICTGQAKLYCGSHNGRVLTMRIALPGEMLGLGAVFSNGCHEVTAKALTSSLIVSIRTHEFLSFLDRYPQAAMQAARALALDYKAALLGARRLSLIPSVEGRLAAALLALSERGSRARGEIRFTMLLTHEELASLAGTTRESVTRGFNKLQENGWIRVHGSAITIVAANELEQLTI